MTNKTDLINEIYQRLVTRITAGQPLENIKRVRIGTVEEARKDNDLPIINIELSNGQEVPRSTSKALVDRMGINITLIHAKSQGNNTLWTTSEGGVMVGALPTFERMLNAIDTGVNGVTDSDFSGYADNLKSISYDCREDEFVVEFTASVTVESKTFYIGGR